MQVKDGVSIQDLQPQALFGMMICDAVFQSLGFPLVITSVREGVHKDNSLHYAGLAFDLRIHHLRGIAAFEVRDRLQQALGREFDVVLEPSHIHVEYDP